MDDAGEQEEQSPRGARKEPARTKGDEGRGPRAYARHPHPAYALWEERQSPDELRAGPEGPAGHSLCEGRWFRGVDSTLLSRRSLNEAGRFPDYGYGTELRADRDDAKRERTHG